MCCGKIKCDTCYNTGSRPRTTKEWKGIKLGLNDKATPYTKVKPRPPNKSLVKR